MVGPGTTRRLRARKIRRGGRPPSRQRPMAAIAKPADRARPRGGARPSRLTARVAQRAAAIKATLALLPMWAVAVAMSRASAPRKRPATRPDRGRGHQRLAVSRLDRVGGSQEECGQQQRGPGPTRLVVEESGAAGEPVGLDGDLIGLSLEKCRGFRGRSRPAQDSSRGARRANNRPSAAWSVAPRRCSVARPGGSGSGSRRSAASRPDRYTASTPTRSEGQVDGSVPSLAT